MMKKIFWLTGSSFFDVDENLVPSLKSKYDIYWVIVCQNKSFYSKEYMVEHMRKNNIKGCVIPWPKLRSFRSFLKYNNLASEIKKGNYDLYYINFLGVPYMFPLFLLRGIDRKKLIYACHDFVDHVQIKNRKFISNYKKIIFRFFYNFQLFSLTQLHLFEEKFKSKKCFFAPLALKGFGVPDRTVKDEKKIVFLYFGKIEDRKGIEYLIQAGNVLNEKYGDRFLIRIYGNCNTWSKYESLFKSTKCFELKIRRIENEEIPNLFSTSHYLILPYKDVTQSGPLLISYYYNVPVIASNHDGFREYIKHGVTGFLFETQNYKSLAYTMEEIILSKYSYQEICNNLSVSIKKNNSLESIVDRYETGFNEILKLNEKQ